MGGDGVQFIVGQKRSSLFLCHMPIWSYVHNMNAMQAPVETSVTPSVLAMKLGGGLDGVVVDVRTPVEFKSGHIPGAILAPLADLKPATFGRNPAADRNRLYLICQ